jgi:two-component system phosphate regulon response regulator PhoB
MEYMTSCKTILVCDDEAHIRRMVALRLREAGFTVIEARDGEEALAAARRARPDLVITDYQMPLLSGLELCKALRLMEQTADVPALMVTARGYILSREDLEATNIREIVSKPFGVRQLVDRAAALLGMEPISRPLAA